MKKHHHEATNKLLEQEFITQEQAVKVTAYRNLDFFSLHNELKILLYLSVLLFTSGMGILIYQNIDTIGHVAILGLLLAVIVACFYFSFKNSEGFKKEATSFSNPVFEYLVLTANVLSCIFIAYLQFQYSAFGTYYGLATLVPTLVSFFCAYYFDSKSSLSIGITGLTAYIGLTINPRAILSNEIYDNPNLSYSAIILGGIFILWTIYSDKIKLKKNFEFVFLTFALHLIAIASIANLFRDYYWFLFEIILAATVYYFYKKSQQLQAISLFFFSVVYAYIGFNVLLFHILDIITLDILAEFYILIAPIYVVASIVLFIKLIKNFNKKENQ